MVRIFCAMLVLVALGYPAQADPEAEVKRALVESMRESQRVLSRQATWYAGKMNFTRMLILTSGPGEDVRERRQDVIEYYKALVELRIQVNAAIEQTELLFKLAGDDRELRNIITFKLQPFLVETRDEIKAGMTTYYDTILMFAPMPDDQADN